MKFKPLVGTHKFANDLGLAVGDFKEMMGKKWRWREGMKGMQRIQR